MKQLKFLIVILMTISITACNSANEPDNLAENDDFFPLRVGDKFLYKLSPDSYTRAFLYEPLPDEIEVKVTGTVDTLGKKYYVINDYFRVSASTSVRGVVYARKNPL